MGGWTVVLRGIRYRTGRSLLVLLLAAIATAATVIAPGYSRAAQQSVLSDQLRAAPVNATSLHVRSDPLTGEAPVLESTSEAKVELRQMLISRPGLTAHLEPPVGGADIETFATPAGAETVLARLAYRDDVCAHLSMAAGDCVTDAGSVMLSERSAAEYGITVGDTLSLRGRSAQQGSPRTLAVAGTYAPEDVKDAYWGRGGYFAAGSPDSESSLPRIDALFVGDEQDLALPGALPSVHLDYRLRAQTVRLDDVARLRSDLSSFETEINRAQIQLTTALPGVLDDVDAEASVLGRTVPIVAVPLVAVCWFILFLLVSALTEERAPEVALAKLRGFSPGQSARFGRAAPLLLVLLAAPPGAAAGLALVEIAARTTLGSGVHVEARWPVLVAAIVAVLAALAAVRFASSRTLARPVLALLRRVPERARWRTGVAEGAVVALAGASLVAAVSDQTAPLALLAPALLALVAGIVTARLLGLWSRVRVGRYARRGRVSGLLAHAQLSRRSLGQRIMLVVTVAVALLSFAATAWDVAAQARKDAAVDTVGADRVFSVEAAHPDALVAAVERASGAAGDDEQVMPVVRVTESYGGGTVDLIGVDSRRMAEVASWRGHGRDAVASVANRLRPEQTAALAVDEFVQVQASVDSLAGAARLAALVAPAGEPVRRVNLGPLVVGSQLYRGATGSCSAGCRLLGLAITRPGVGGTDALAAVVRVNAIATSGGPVSAEFDAPGRWRANTARVPKATVRVEPGTALRVQVNSTDPGDVVIEYVDTPDVLPVVVAGGTPADDAAAQEFTFPALAEVPQRFAVVAREETLPRVGGRALLFDLDYAVRSAERTSALSDNTRLRYEVWATAAAPADLSSRLAAAGLQVLGEQSIDAERDRLSRGAPALGLRLYLIAGGAAVALAVGAVLLTAYVGAQTRKYELAALGVAGIRPGVLRRSLLREYAHLLGLPFLVGLVAGVAGAALMLPGIPLVTVGTPTGAIAYTPGFGALPVAVGATIVGLLAAVLIVIRLVRRATPDRLREGGIG